MAKSKGRVVVAMSGGVDSSVCAALLVEQGYEVIGIMLRLWSESGRATQRDNRCCTRDQMIDAHFVAKQLGIPFHIVDARDEFKHTIVDFFVNGYATGITPNPCLVCNREIRFTLLLNQALEMGASHLATGHYARIRRAADGTFELHKAVDPNKDQSYVLSVLNQHQLSHAMFPVGDYTKTEVRALAARLRLGVAHKGDSQDLCFVADGDYRRFMRANAQNAFKPGPIMLRSGEILGQHHGFQDYTIGQRKGLGLSWCEPLYVIAKDSETNTLTVGTRDELGSREFQIVQVNWINGTAPTEALTVDVKVRYKALPVRARVVPTGADGASLRLDKPLPDITPGQGAVLYDGEQVLGCGIIT